jgi:hypothetical protein
MATSSYLTPAMQNLSSIEASNQATDYMRMKDEIARQQAILNAQRNKQNSVGQHMLRGAVGAIPGLIAGIPGGPVGMAIGAGAGFTAGALAPVGTDAAALGVMGANMAGKGSSWRSGSVNNPDIPNTQAPGTTPLPVGQPGGLSVPLNMKYPSIPIDETQPLYMGGGF